MKKPFKIERLFYYVRLNLLGHFDHREKSNN